MLINFSEGVPAHQDLEKIARRNFSTKVSAMMEPFRKELNALSPSQREECVIKIAERLVVMVAKYGDRDV